MHGRAPSEYLRGKERQRGILAAIRQHLKKANYHNFNDLLHAFRHYDKVLRNQLFSYVGVGGVGCDFFSQYNIFFNTN